MAVQVFLRPAQRTKYLYAAVRDVERDPIRAELAQKAEDYRWSSAGAHVRKTKDPFLIAGIDDWAKYLEEEDNDVYEELIK